MNKSQKSLLIKSGVPKGAALKTGKRGGKYYESGGKKIYVKTGEQFKTPHAEQMSQEIGSMRNLNDITSSIFHIDKLVSEGKIESADVDRLYQVAENQMKKLNSAIITAKDKKTDKRKDEVTNKRGKQESLRKERKSSTTKKYNEKISKMKNRISRWKGIVSQLDGISEKVKVSEVKVNQKVEVMKTAIGKLKEKKAVIKNVSGKIPKGHPNYGKLVDAIKKYNIQSQHVKLQTSKLNEARKQITNKKRKIESIRGKADRIIKNYIKEASELKEMAF